MSAASAVANGRIAAESLMVDTGRIRRQTGTTPDAETLEEVPTYADVWSGPCRVQRSGALSPRDSSTGGYEFGIKSLIAQLPISATGMVRGDVFEVTAVGSISDPSLVGLVATVEADLSKTHATKRTLVCEEVSA